MKRTILTYLTILFLASCSKDENEQNQVSKLPPETQIGANTFGCIINGNLFYPRDGYGGLGGSGANAIKLIATGIYPNYISHYLDVNNFRDGKPINNFILHIHNLNSIGIGEYDFKLSNFQKGVDSPPHTHLYIRAFHEASGGYKWYGSTENSGKLIITKYNIDTKIVSGTFSGVLKEYNGEETVNITNGRFDINWYTISDQKFP
jgi:hypothetical protein